MKTFLGGLLLSLAMATTLTHVAQAQSYPTRPVTFIIGYAPGGSIDTLGRIVAQELSKKWPRSVIVENRAGADSVIAARSVAGSSPDGHTIFVASNSLAITATQPDLGYDPAQSFKPAVLVASVPNVLVIHPKHHVKTLKELVALAKAKPKMLNFGTPGNSSPASIELALLVQKTNIDVVNIPYKGVAPAMADLVGGHIDVMFASLTSALPFIEEGKLTPLAMSTKVYSPLLPKVPPVAEQLGIEFDEAGTWIALIAPAATPDAITTKIRDNVREALKDPEVIERLTKLGFVTSGMGADEFRVFLKSEMATAAQIITTLEKQ